MKYRLFTLRFYQETKTLSQDTLVSSYIYQKIDRKKKNVQNEKGMLNIMWFFNL